jgi:isoquinoline 1-oxidoreductase beta subunit
LPASPDDPGGAPSRRQFLASSLAAAGLSLVVPLGAACRPDARPLAARPPFTPEGWLTIDPTGGVTLLVGQTEMGQGIHTAFAMLVAEELGIAVDRIMVRTADADPAFNNPLMQRQRTSWSASIRGWWRPLREGGAAARQLLVAEAAERWGLAAGECRVTDGVVHAPDGRSAEFGELAAGASRRPYPRSVTLTPRERFRVIGRSQARVELADKTSGRARFGLDLRLPGLLFCVLARPPHAGAVPQYRKDPAAGDVRIVETPLGIAFAAPTTWQALQARRLAAIQWSGGTPPAPSKTLRPRLSDATLKPEIDHEAGDVERALRAAASRVEAEYFFPYVAHTPMEPLNCIAELKEGRCHVIVPTQDQTAAVAAAAEVSGLPPAAVTVETPLAGGGFGRRVHQDVIREAVTVARLLEAPVQVVWSREDDLQHDFYRPACLHRMRGAITGSGISAWSHQIVGQSASGASGLPYRLPNALVSHTTFAHDLPTGIWRAVDDGPNACAIESFIDELADSASLDPVELRRTLLMDARAKAVFEQVVTASKWTSPLPPGQGRGIALHGMTGSWVALVIEVSVDQGKLRVLRAVAAIDCGTAVHPDGIRAQVEGSVAMGLSAALHEEITVADGQVANTNLDRYRLLRMDEMPTVETVIIDSAADPGGVGEVALPPVAPALLNAIANAAGVRIRSLPIGRQLRERLTRA